MRTPSHNDGRRRRPSILAIGLTLVELLVVIVIFGLMLGLVSMNAVQSEQQLLQNEAQRIALLLQIAREEAIVRNHQVAFEANADRYRFLVREGNAWQPITKDNMLREREFKRPPVFLTVSPPVAGSSNILRVIFGREPVHTPFVMTLSSGGVSATIRADGIGHFQAE